MFRFSLNNKLAFCGSLWQCCGAMIHETIIRNLNSFSAESLARENLGVHFNFKQAVPTLQRLFTYLKEITDSNLSLLTPEEVQEIESAINALLKIREQILEFDPQLPNAAISYRSLMNSIGKTASQIFKNLRPIYSFLKVGEMNPGNVLERAKDALQEVEKAQKTLNDLTGAVSKLPNQAQAQFNESLNRLQERLTNVESDYRKRNEAITNEQQQHRKIATRETEEKIAELDERLLQLTNEANTKIDDVLKQARNFSAKAALVTYAQIFNNEAEENNKPAIRLWNLTLICLSLTEIAAALALFFWFLPEVLEISKNYGDNLVGASLIASAILVKIFILSVIAVGIGHAIKNLNAQNHLYSTNKFKSNSLASFQAFLEATTNPMVIDSIIQKVSEAVYTQGISGYLSKDDSGVRPLESSVATDLIGKVLNR